MLGPRTYAAGGLDLGGEWSIQFDEHIGVKYYALVSGAAWLAVEGQHDPVRLEAGDCVLLPNGRRFIVARDLAFKATRFAEIPESEWKDGMATLNGGGDATMLAGHFGFSGAHVTMLLGQMPAIVSLREEQDKAGLRWVLERMRRELSESRPAASFVVQQLAHLMLVQVLRLYLSCHVGRGVGWLFALSDSRIAPTIHAIHANPGTSWTLPALARTAGMSRSKFALRFKNVTGYSPIEYLTHWRMLLAGDRLRRGGEPVSVIALSLGYESEAAFSTAFRRVMGVSPRKYSVQDSQSP